MSVSVRIIFSSVVLILSLLCFWWLLAICIVSAKPNEWLLVINGGEMRSAGVGTTAVLGPFDKAVVFPASIRKVGFTAQQVSKEMQGIEVSGFLVWAIYREGDGPFKAYKYGMVGSPELLYQADSNIRGMAESIVRHQVANLGLSEVIVNRELLRDTVRAEMLKVVQGWGMWLETVEVTDVRVLSQRVFDDLQIEFRQDLHKKAETVRLNTTKELGLLQLDVDSETKQHESEVRAEQANRDLWIELENKKQEAKIQELTHDLELKRLEREKALELIKVKNNAEVKIKETLEELKLIKLREESELELLKKRMEVDKGTPQVTMQKEMMKAVKEIYSQLPIREVKLFNSGSSKGLDGLLPGLVQLTELVKNES